MLTLQVPTLLALLGTVLMAVVIFAPVPAAAKVTLSPAPPLMPSPSPSRTPPLPFERWDAPPDDVFTPPFLEREPGWPALVDARAAGCDAAARLALVDALVAVRAPWADAILQRALDDEPDALVRDAIGAARERSDAR
ncbi:MAG: hypothetical protein QOD51_208 [Candidatus Eremiobacteraeota bacterium]|jgi:hypothetical protein|nr:hypothetical protein [Candidatus Eremiobacteraeota bacterium]